MDAKNADRKVVAELERIVKKSRGKFSPEDAIAETGYSLEQVNDGLSRLIELYESRVTMDRESGKLQFIFKYPLFKRGSKTAKEIILSALDVIWKGFTYVYKASVGIVLILYTVIFVLLLLAIMLAGRGDSSRDSKFDFGDIIGGVFRGIFDVFYIMMWTRTLSYHTDQSGYRYRAYEPEKNKGKNFIFSVFNFVFGPEHPKYDPLDDAKEIAAFIRKNNGKITAGHIVALTGIDYEKAESRLAEYASKFNGDLYIDTDGTIVGDFSRLMNKVSKELEGGKIIFYENEVEAPYELTGNTKGRNVVIAAMNSFNLLMSLFVISIFSSGQDIQFAYEEQMYSLGTLDEYSWVAWFLGYFPLVISALFFVIPIFRSFDVKAKNKKREYNILRKKLIGAFVRNRGREAKLSDILRTASINDEKSIEKAKRVLERLIIELKGELNFSSEGEPVYSFPRLARELHIS